MAEYTTLAPTGLQVTRKGSEFTFSWVIRDQDHGGGQLFQYNFGGRDKKWHAVQVTEKQTSVVLTINTSLVTKLSFRVRGRRKAFTQKKDKDTITIKPRVSAWAGKIPAWVPAMPTKPTVSYERTSANTGTFTVKHKADDDGRRVVNYVQYQSCASTTTAYPPKSGWSATTNLNGKVDVDTDVNYTEQTEYIQKTGVVRWFRARCTGPGGTTAWVYSRHAYSKPVAPALKSASAAKQANRGITNITAQWSSTTNVKQPIDEETLQYCIGKPVDNACNAPSNGWTDALTVTPTGKKDIVTASVEAVSTTDECMWVRVAAVHDESENVSYSKTIRVRTERLAAPGISATVNFSTGATSVTLTINTQCSVARHVIFYRNPKKPKTDVPVAVLAAGVTTWSGTINAFKGASKSSVGAYAFVGTNSGTSVNALMTSPSAVDEDIAAVPPATPTLSQLSNTSVFVNFGWQWAEATTLEIGYADSQYAWQSSNPPKTCLVEDTGATKWVVEDLTPGKVWYFRARYKGIQDGEEITTSWSGMASIDLATTPETPILTLNRGFVLPGGVVGASWTYVNEDSSAQESAQVCLCNVSGQTVTYGNVIAHATGGQTVTVSNTWARGTTYYLAVRVKSAAGRYSEWSTPASVYVPSLPTVSVGGITDNLMADLSSALTAAVSVDSAPGQFGLSITRATDFHVARPDDGVFDGFEGETIWTTSESTPVGSSSYSYTITKDDLIGQLDDGGHYLLTGIVTDDYGQTATDSIPFEVDWAHKAEIAKPTVQADNRTLSVRITPTTPESYVAGDTFDIYRLTVDKPELIVQDGEYGTTYVDPFPAFGPLCGHRVVAKTSTGSYINEDVTIAWYDLGYDDGDTIDCQYMVIDADGMQITLPYNVELSNRWQKDFTRTAYLGGSVQGDWNPAVLRDLSAKTVIVRETDTGELMDMRDLANYAGAAHIRTPDGSSFTCDIQVSEDASYGTSKVSYNLTIKGIGAQEPDGMTLAEWLENHPVG